MQRLKLLFSILIAIPGCATDSQDSNGEDLDGDGKADGGSSTVSADNLNGLWDGTFDGAAIEDVVIRSWDGPGIVIEIDGKTHTLKRTSNKLAAEGVALVIDPREVGQRDDAINGTVDGKKLELVRDVEIKDTIRLELPRDRPYRMFLHDTLMPLSHQDRESYVVMDAAKIKDFMQSTVLFKAGSFQRKYMKGATRAEQSANMLALIDQLDGIESTPRSLLTDVRYTSAVKASLKDQSLAGLALVNFNLYFTTGAGRALILPLTDDAMAFFITDRPTRGAKLGLVVMDTPTHGPLASTFGRQLLDLGEADAPDTVTYAKTMMNLLVKSDPTGAEELSPFGRSALVDWFAVMAIEDYRGVAFGNPLLGWGYNITNVQLFGLVTRALARPGAVDDNGDPVIGQVIVGNELRPGDPSYADVLNNGNDMQEFGDMAKLKKLTTDYLRQEHAALVTEVERAFAEVIPTAELDGRAKADIFHYITAHLYDVKGRQSVLVGAKADRAIAAVTALVEAMVADSAKLEAFILTKGVTKSNRPAPKATGF